MATKLAHLLRAGCGSTLVNNTRKAAGEALSGHGLSSSRLGGAISVQARFSSTKKPEGSSSTSGKTLNRAPSFINVSRPQVTGTRTAEEAVNNILYNLPTYKEPKKRHILSIFVDNEVGVLSKVSGLLSARGFNIDSLTVSATDVKDLSRMTIVLNGPDAQIEQAKRQLEDLCDVWAVLDYKVPENTFERELLLVKVNCIPPNLTVESENLMTDENASLPLEEERPPGLSYEELMAIHFHRSAILEIANMFGGKVSDVGSEHMIIELVAWSARVDAFLKMLQPYGVVEAARSGAIAMGRAKVLERKKEEEEIATIIDLTDLPPS